MLMISIVPSIVVCSMLTENNSCHNEQLGISSTLFKTIAGSYNRERKRRDFLLRSEFLQLVIDFTVINTRFLPREGRFVVETGKLFKNILSLAKSK